MSSQRALVHPQLGWISGMCSDEAPHTEIDRHVLAAKNAAHALEAERDELLEELELAAEQGRLVGMQADRYRKVLIDIAVAPDDFNDASLRAMAQEAIDRD